MLTLDEILVKLQDIEKMGYVKTHRVKDTGIGKTLEDLIGIQENNFPSSNGHKIELKSGRKDKTSMVSLFTKSPLPRGSNTKILQEYGYLSDNGRNKLEVNLSSKTFNLIKGTPRIKTNVTETGIELVDTHGKVSGSWPNEILKRFIERKLPEVLYVKANSKGSGENEMFWYNEAWVLSGLDFDTFLRMVSEDNIIVNIRIGQYPNGKTHDHGTGFRVLPSKLELCFKNRRRVL
ncbi:MAG: hypothetical protein A4E35_01531 [Methanoregula sp. PtaU1.Bin051]|nr:MAG: hypothetical protein A4E35_01531 [Methanoregula sp. PtaU1.Bin051]